MRHPYGDLDVDVAPGDVADRSAWLYFYSEDQNGVTHAFEVREYGQEGADRFRHLARELNDAADAIEAGELP